jgi:hypothetical protein
MTMLAYYTIELARPPDGWVRLQELSAHAREATVQMQGEGIPVRFLRLIFVPEDGACFHLYEAASADVVREAARRAALPFQRVAGVVTESKGERK